jgi:hypothetical protein
MSHYPKFADPAREDRPVEQRPGEGPPMSDLAAAGDGDGGEDLPGGDFAEEA